MPSPKTSLFTTIWPAGWCDDDDLKEDKGKGLGKYWQMSTAKTFPSIVVGRESERSQESAISDKSNFPHHRIQSFQSSHIYLEGLHFAMKTYENLSK